MRTFSTAVKTAQSTWERVATAVPTVPSHWSFDERLRTRSKRRRRKTPLADLLELL